MIIFLESCKAGDFSEPAPGTAPSCFIKGCCQQAPMSLLLLMKPPILPPIPRTV